jgi:hypothetical protein
MPKLFSGTGAVSLSVAGLLLGGCAGGGDDATPLKPQAFYSQKRQGQASGGRDVTANRQVEQAPVKSPQTAAAPKPAPTDTRVAQTSPTTRPVMAAMPSTSSGNFIVLGTVVAEANGAPVYADKVLSRIEDALAANAKRLEPREYRMAASQLIDRAIMEQITDELEFAAAQRNTTPEDQQLAAGATTMWRQKEITKAGGSEAVARAKSSDDGMDFDERTRQQFRRHLIQIYYMKQVWPKVQVSANDVRRFYDQNVEQLYSEKSAVRFRAIRINLKQRGKEKAWEAATDALSKARSGWDFAKLATNPQWNDNATWRANGGYWDMAETKNATGQTVKDGVWTEKGTLAAEELEKAVFALNPGEVTDVIQTADALYVAKVEEKKTGRVLPFEDLKVQADIRDRMEKQQRTTLRFKEQQKLQDNKYWHKNDRNIELTVDMAMQNYESWRRPTESAQAR